MPETPNPVPPCRITIDDGDLFELALRLPDENARDAALAKIIKLIMEREAP